MLSAPRNFAFTSGGATTTWNYEAFRGWLTNKTYDGNTAGPKYTYTAAGRLASRIWARGVTTTYSYGGAGDLAGVSYSDGTASLGYGYDRRGRQSTITQGSVTTTRAYDDAGDMLSESYTGGSQDGLSVVNIYDNLLRRATNGVKSGSTWLTQTRYGYDAASRLSAVSAGTNSATYAYLANSPLVSQIAFTNGSVGRMTTTKQYDNLNRLLSVSSVPSAASALNFDYSYNSANQRTSVTNTDSARWVYTYDSLGQVTSGKKYWSDGTPVAGEQFEYTFDDIGNRETTRSGGDSAGANLRSAAHANNGLNQINWRTVPGYVDILGEASSNAVITVNNQRPYRKGEFFRKEFALDNSSSPLWFAVTNLAGLHTATNDIVVTNSGNTFIPKTTEVFGYDADGNMTNDGRWTITWDAENRATSFTSLSNGPSASKKKIDCTYDYAGRRVQKIVSTNSSSTYVAQSTNRFVYDDWNLIAILSPLSSLQSSFTWGTDLSGTAQGAGGVGGLLFIGDFVSAIGYYAVAYDANGNVSALINAANGTASAQYEYGPFGEVLRATGSMGFANPLRFSTKYQDDESGFLNYGFRYFSPSSGKWLTRDPIAERGGINLSGFVRNDPVDYIDKHGLYNPIIGPDSQPAGPGAGLPDPLIFLPPQLRPPVPPPPAPPKPKRKCPCPLSLSQFGLPGEAGFGLSASAGALLPVTGVGPSFGFEGSFSAMVTTECRYCISAQGTLLAGVGVMGSIGAGGAASYAAGSLSGPGAGFGFGAAGGGVEGAPLGGTVSYDVDLLNQGLGAAEAHVGPTIALAGYGRAFVSCTGCADPLNGGWLDRLFPQVVAQQRLAQCILSNVAKLAGQAFR